MDVGIFSNMFIVAEMILK